MTSVQTAYSRLSQATTNMGDESRVGFQTVNSHLANVESANRTRHQAVLGLLNDHAQSEDHSAQTLNKISQQQTRVTSISEAGFRAVSVKLSQIGSQIQRIQRDQIAFAPTRNGVPSLSGRLKASNLVTSEATVFWRHDSYSLPIGTLQIIGEKVRRSKSSKHLASQDRADSVIKVTFAPPRWLSKFAIKYTMKLCHDLTTSQWHWGVKLQPLTVNHNPLFIEAIRSCDVEFVRKSFREGSAQKTDYFLTPWGLGPWFKVILHLNCQSRHTNSISQEFGIRVHGPKFDNEKMLQMVEFMIKEGLPGQ